MIEIRQQLLQEMNMILIILSRLFDLLDIDGGLNALKQIVALCGILLKLPINCIECYLSSEVKNYFFMLYLILN